MCLFSKKNVFCPLNVSYTILINKLMNKTFERMSTRMTRTMRYCLDQSFGYLSKSVMFRVENWTENRPIKLSQMLSNLKSELIHSPP